MKPACCMLLLAAGLAAGPPPGEGWAPLLNGRDLAGWRAQDPEKGAWSPAENGAWLVNGPAGKISNIVTERKFGDMELYLEFLVPAKSNSGVYLHGLYEVQILDSWGVKKLHYGDCGGIYCRLVDGRPVGGTPPAVNASRPPGEWQSFQIRFRAPRFDATGRKTANAVVVEVLHNGSRVQRDVELEGPTHSSMPVPEAPENPLMLQGDHGPVTYRNIYWRPLAGR